MVSHSEPQLDHQTVGQLSVTIANPMSRPGPTSKDTRCTEWSPGIRAVLLPLLSCCFAFSTFAGRFSNCSEIFSNLSPGWLAKTGLALTPKFLLCRLGGEYFRSSLIMQVPLVLSPDFENFRRFWPSKVISMVRWVIFPCPGEKVHSILRDPWPLENESQIRI